MQPDETAYTCSMHGFVLLPDKMTEAKIVEFNNTHFSEPLKLIPGLIPPHVTVLQAPIRTGFKATPFLEHFRASYSLKHEASTRIGELSLVNDSWLFLGVQNASWLKELNRLIVDSVADWIDVSAAPAKDVFSNEAERTSYEKTGYRYNLEAYSPHFTVGVVEDTNTETIILPGSQDLVGRRVNFRQLAFCEHGPHGQIKNVLESIPLPSNWD
jgi:hypothetical protein